MNLDGAATARTHRAVDFGLYALGMVLAVITSLAVTLPVVPAIVSERLDIAIITAATMVSVAVAALNWARGRVAGDGAALFRGSAFAVLAVLNGLILLVQVAGVDAAFGMSLEDPGQLPLIASVLGRGRPPPCSSAPASWPFARHRVSHGGRHSSSSSRPRQWRS